MSVQGNVILGFAKFGSFPCKVYGWFQLLEHTRLTPGCPLPELCPSHLTLLYAQGPTQHMTQT